MIMRLAKVLTFGFSLLALGAAASLKTRNDWKEKLLKGKNQLLKALNIAAENVNLPDYNETIWWTGEFQWGYNNSVAQFLTPKQYFNITIAPGPQLVATVSSNIVNATITGSYRDNKNFSTDFVGTGTLQFAYSYILTQLPDKIHVTMNDPGTVFFPSTCTFAAVPNQDFAFDITRVASAYFYTVGEPTILREIIKIVNS